MQQLFDKLTKKHWGDEEDIKWPLSSRNLYSNMKEIILSAYTTI